MMNNTFVFTCRFHELVKVMKRKSHIFLEGGAIYKNFKTISHTNKKNHQILTTSFTTKIIHSFDLQTVKTKSMKHKEKVTFYIPDAFFQEREKRHISNSMVGCVGFSSFFPSHVAKPACLLGWWWWWWWCGPAISGPSRYGNQTGSVWRGVRAPPHTPSPSTTTSTGSYFFSPSSPNTFYSFAKFQAVCSLKDEGLDRLENYFVVVISESDSDSALVGPSTSQPTSSLVCNFSHVLTDTEWNKKTNYVVRNPICAINFSLQLE